MGNFMQPRHCQLIGAVVLLVGAGVVYWRFGQTSSVLPDHVSYVCVATGKVFRFSQATLPNSMPGRNPETGQSTLLPLTPGASAKLSVDEHYAALLEDPELAEVNKYVDPDTLEVRTTPR
jgi:hypothetical protein